MRWNRLVSTFTLLCQFVMAGESWGAEPLPRSPLTIKWREGPEYPLGIQDSALGVIGGTLVSAGGFSRHPRDVVNRFPDAFAGKKSGFTKIAFELDFANEAAGWNRIPDMPGPARQAAATVVVDDVLYAFGGLNYDPPHTYRNACRLQRHNGKWDWEELHQLPFPICEASAVAIDRKIYLVGGSDFFAASDSAAKDLVGDNADFYTDADRDRRAVGNGLWVLDTTNVFTGWQQLPDRPGTGQAFAACAAVSGKVLVLGGLFSAAQRPKSQYQNAVDSWAYDVATQSWSRLPDIPHGSNRRAIAYRDRYVILVGGFKYGQTRQTDGLSIDVYSEAEKVREFKDGIEKTVLVYDVQSQRFEAADPLLDQTSWPMLTIKGDTIYCLGGEGGARLWHPATLQIGKVAVP